MWSHDYTQPGLAWREWGQSLQSWRLKYEINLRWLTPNQWKDWDISHNFIFSHEKTGTTILNWTDVFYYTKWYNRKKYLVKLNQEWPIPWSTSESSYIENSRTNKINYLLCERISDIIYCNLLCWEKVNARLIVKLDQDTVIHLNVQI